MRNMEAIAVCNTIGNLQSYVTLSIAAMALNATPSRAPLGVRRYAARSPASKRVSLQQWQAEETGRTGPSCGRWRGLEDVQPLPDTPRDPDEGQRVEPRHRVEFPPFLADAEAQPVLVLGDEQGAEYPIPQRQREAEVLAGVLRFDAVVDLVMGGTLDHVGERAAHRQPDVGVAQMKDGQVVDQHHDVHLQQRKFLRAGAEQIDEHTVGRSSRQRDHVERQQILDRMRAKRGEGIEHLGRMMNLVELP